MAELPIVLVLCGGLGTRVSKLSSDLPKAMLPILGTPFIGHQLKLLAKQSIKEVILCVGHRQQPLIDYVGSGENFGIHVRFSHDGNTQLGTGGAIRKALNTYSLDNPFAIIYGDSYLDTSFKKIYESFLESDKKALMTVFKNDNKWIPSNINCESGLVSQYKKDSLAQQLRYVDYGMSIFCPEVFSKIVPGQVFDLADIFQSLINNRQLAAYEVKERFYEAGSVTGIAELEIYLANHIN